MKHSTQKAHQRLGTTNARSLQHSFSRNPTDANEGGVGAAARRALVAVSTRLYHSEKSDIPGTTLISTGCITVRAEPPKLGSSSPSWSLKTQIRSRLIRASCSSLK